MTINDSSPSPQPQPPSATEERCAGIHVVMLPYDYQPSDEEIERERQRRRQADERRAAAAQHRRLMTAEELLKLAEERREAILTSLRQGQRGVSVEDGGTFAQFLRGEMTSCFPLPNLERLWNAAYALGIPEVPPWPGEPDDSPSALERLGVLISWLQGQHGKPAEGAETLDDAVRAYLGDNRGAAIRKVVDALGSSIGAVQKTNAWKEEMKRREKEEPAIRQTPFPTFGGVGVVDADAQFYDYREPNPADAAIAAEEATDEGIWQRLIDGTKEGSPQRAALNAANTKIQKALIQAVREGCSGDDPQEIVKMLASQRADVESEAYHAKKRRRSREQA